MSTAEVTQSRTILPEGHSTHRRPAFLKPPVTISAPTLLISTPPPIEKSPSDLKPLAQAYDGTPIVVVPPDYQQAVAASFEAGMYGFDTESDCHTRELRIVQIYTGKVVYIFDTSVFQKLSDNFFIKFLRSKDRIKVGVDIDTDIFRIQEYYRNIKPTGPGNWSRYKEKFVINGCLDIQSIARTMGETFMGLEKLGAKYVPGFQGNPSNLGNYNPPTLDQYIYAANDAVISLKIYRPLVNATPAATKILESDLDSLFDQFHELFTADEPASLNGLLRRVVETYQPWKDFSVVQKSSLALRTFGEMSRRGYFTHFDLLQDIIWLSNKPWPPSVTVVETILPTKAESPSSPVQTNSPNPPEIQTKPPGRRKKPKKPKNRKTQKQDELDSLDSLIKEIDAQYPVAKSSPSPPPTELNISVANRQTNSTYNMKVNAKLGAGKVAELVIEQLRILDEVVAALSKGPLKRQRSMHETFLQTFTNAKGEIEPAFLHQLFPDHNLEDQDMVNDALEEMKKTEKEMTNEMYRQLQDELLAYLVANKLLTTALPYPKFIAVVGELIPKVLPNCGEGKKILLGNIFVHIGLENNHIASNQHGDLRLVGKS